jgi:hypothetical protein
MLFSGMSAMVVMPPAAAAAVAVANPSHCVRPGSFTCTWLSTSPGSSTHSSGTMTSPAAGPASVISVISVIPVITPSRATTTPERSPAGVMMRRARSRTSGPGAAGRSCCTGASVPLLAARPLAGPPSAASCRPLRRPP